MMRAGQVLAPGQIEWTDAPAPSDLAPGEVLIRPAIGGICGSDLPYFTRAETFTGEHPGPGSPLHEIVGSVIASKDPTLEVGNTVVGWAGNNDGLAELVRTLGSDVAVTTGQNPAHTVVAQPLAAAFAALERLTTPLEGAHVAVLGLGPIGLLFAHAAAHLGAARVTGVDPVGRIDPVTRFGVDDDIRATAEQWASGLEQSDRPQIVLEVVGHEFSTLGAAIEAAAPWGEIFYFGVPQASPYEISMAAMLRKQLTLQSGTTATDRRRHLTRALEHLQEFPHLAPLLVTHELGADEIQAAYTLAASQAPGVGKVVVHLDQRTTTPASPAVST